MGIESMEIGQMAVGAFSLIGVLAVGGIQLKTSKGTRRDDRVTRLEAALGEMYRTASETREANWATVDRLMQEEEELREAHAAKMETKRERIDELRLKVTELRAELLRRGVNPDRVSETALAPASGTPLQELAGRFPEDGAASKRIVGGRRSDDPPCPPRTLLT